MTRSHINPNKHTIALANLAAHNGEVEIISHENGFNETKSTKSTPLKEMVIYKEDQSLLHLLFDAVMKIRKLKNEKI
jgi:hypothetical protein